MILLKSTFDLFEHAIDEEIGMRLFCDRSFDHLLEVGNCTLIEPEVEI